MDLRFELLTEQTLDYLWRNFRDIDRRECEAVGITEDNYRYYYLEMAPEPWIVALVDGVPVCMMGCWPIKHCVWFCLLGTEQMDRYWVRLTRNARSFIKNRLDDYLGCRGMVVILEEATQARRWLEYLGFEQTGQPFWSGVGVKHLLYEFRR
ncbi:hypothetical protein [Pacificispira sp.]|uniref:hypothetical protein n=1 Tax=Pacificispira sp. TaxID=2888761 RepID=UPI003BAA5CBC